MYTSPYANFPADAENMVEVTDADDQPLLLMDKDLAHVQDVPHRWVLAAFYDRLGHLWLRRVVLPKIEEPVWDFSVRAHVPAGEARESTVERLLAQEFGITGVQPVLRAVFPALEGEGARHFSLFTAGRRGMQAASAAGNGIFLDRDELAGLAEHFPSLLHPDLLWCMRKGYLK